MSRGKIWMIQGLFCFAALSLCLVIYLEKQNALTKLRLRIPKLAAEIGELQEGNTHLLYQIQALESPSSLLRIVEKFSHLRHPLEKEVLVIQEGSVVQSPTNTKTSKHSLAAGSK